ncbi:complement C1q tumor necrosis factor-related protein 3-like [Megalops cyprinoides]|uniref:complement C1q tumor necrosis factor-related protein 3-like n=1 Tax=Megalops cyprinoides TaxID=118141 RepID=UPI001864CF14|nr:complement C1q tumor necrosis factor-related protein 3-like [Megalops cyprinoides]
MKNFVVPLVLLCCLTATQTQKSDAGKESQAHPEFADKAGVEPTCQPDVHSVLKELRVVEARLKAAESQIEELTKADKERPKVAFSTSLGGSGNVGPFNADTTLVYTIIFTNVGNAYNPKTGIFTAPVKGVYYFRFTTHSSGVGDCVARLMKNGELIVTGHENRNGEVNETTANGAAILLEAGEQVYMRLVANTFIFDDPRHASTFSGFLLFPM